MCPRTTSRNSGIWIGFIILTVGLFLLLDRMDIVFVPHWLFSWEVLLIVIGLVIGIKSNFKSIGWLIMILLGTFFLVDEIPGFEYLRYYSFPIGVIIVGLFLIIRSSVTRQRMDSERGKHRGGPANTARVTEIFGSNEHSEGSGSSEDYIDLTTVFGGIKKRVFSKSFKGGSTTNFFGGTEIDLTQADIQGTAVLDIVQAFGGVKLLVPANWEVKSDLTAILGSVEDKRSTATTPSPDKKLVLDGTCIFGGIEIKSF